MPAYLVVVDGEYASPALASGFRDHRKSGRFVCVIRCKCLADESVEGLFVVFGAHLHNALVDGFATTTHMLRSSKVLDVLCQEGGCDPVMGEFIRFKMSLGF